MDQLKNKIMENLLLAQDFIANAFHDLRKAYYDKENGETEIKRVSKFITAAKSMVDVVYRAAKACKLFEEHPEKAAKEVGNNLPYPQDMADILAGMQPGDFNFLRGLAPDLPTNFPKNTA